VAWKGGSCGGGVQCRQPGDIRSVQRSWDVGSYCDNVVGISFEGCYVTLWTLAREWVVIIIIIIIIIIVVVVVKMYRFE